MKAYYLITALGVVVFGMIVFLLIYLSRKKPRVK